MVPVLDKDKQPLMSCLEKQARKLMEKGEAKTYWSKGIFCIILQKDPFSRKKQDIIVSINPDNKRTSVTVVTDTKMVLNILINTPSWVKDNIKLKKTLRRNHRSKNIGSISPSTKFSWQTHLRILVALSKTLPVTDVEFEDVSAKTMKERRRRNVNFIPLEVEKMVRRTNC